MTVNPESECNGPIQLSTTTIKHAHWLPFAADTSCEVTPCDVDGYFVVNETENEISSTFRGRNLLGMKVDLGEFSWYVCICF